MVSLGVGYRLDNDEDLTQYPSVNFRVYHYFSGLAAIKGEFGYNHDTKINTYWTDERIGIKDVLLGIGVRLHKQLKHMQFYIEPGFNYHHYISDDGVATDSRFGWDIALGNSFELSPRTFMDVSIRKTINYRNYEDDIIDVLYPPTYQYAGNSSTPFIKALYNPVELRMSFNFKL